MKNNKRIPIFDTLRGFAFINMVIYHTLYDLVYIFNLDLPWFLSYGSYIWEQIIAGTFIVISGISCYFSKNLLKNGVIVLGAGILLTIFTNLFTPSLVIWFGILHFLGASMIIIGLVKDILLHINPIIGASSAGILFLLFKSIPAGSIGIGDIRLITLPQKIYSTNFLFPLGFPSSEFSSSDYFPLIPWIFLMLIGFYGIVLLKKTQILEKIGDFNILFLSCIGKKTLLLYMIHQPIIYGVCVLLSKIGIL